MKNNRDLQNVQPIRKFISTIYLHNQTQSREYEKYDERMVIDRTGHTGILPDRNETFPHS